MNTYKYLFTTKNDGFALYIHFNINLFFLLFFIDRVDFLIFVYFAFVLVGCCKVCIDYNFKRMQWLIIVRFTCTCVSDSGEYRISARFSVVWIRLVFRWIRLDFDDDIGYELLVFSLFYLLSFFTCVLASAFRRKYTAHPFFSCSTRYNCTSCNEMKQNTIKWNSVIKSDWMKWVEIDRNYVIARALRQNKPAATTTMAAFKVCVNMWA